MRGWMLLKFAGVDFSEIHLPLYGDEARAKVRALGGQTGLVPVLLAERTAIWDTMAIAEYLYEKAPQIWPSERLERARARSLAAEMHSGFTNIRMQMPCNMRVSDRSVDFTEALDAEVRRITEIWSSARGPWLCGEFCAVDIMFAPVATRFRTYGVELEKNGKILCSHLLEHPLTRAWLDLAGSEPVVEKYERGRQ